MKINSIKRDAFGLLIKGWRSKRGKSQLDLAFDAGVSPRHISFLETGRALPSREMVLHLASTLNIPYREQNDLLTAAGFAPLFGELDLNDPRLDLARQALDLILKQHEPYPAVVMNRHWDLIKVNKGAEKFFNFLLSDSSAKLPGIPNVIRLIFHPSGLRPFISNWEIVAKMLIQRVHREAVGNVLDFQTTELLKEVTAYPDIPKEWTKIDPSFPLEPVLPVGFKKEDYFFRFFSTVTVLGTPQDIALQELRIESFFPADAETRLQADKFFAA